MGGIRFTVTASGLYRLIWEVAGADPKIGSALTIDNVRVNGSLLFGFEAGIPGGFDALGTVGTSGSVTVTTADGSPAGLQPDRGDQFAYLDITKNGVTPIFDTVDGFVASRLYSTVFTLNAGDTLTMDLAFLTNEGDPFYDYGIAALVSVPEPSSLVASIVALVARGAIAGLKARVPHRVTMTTIGQRRPSLVTRARSRGRTPRGRACRPRRSCGRCRDRPTSGAVLGVAVAVLLDQPVEELEELAGRPQVAQGVLEVVVADRLVDELAEPGPVGRSPSSTARRWPRA